MATSMYNDDSSMTDDLNPTTMEQHSYGDLIGNPGDDELDAPLPPPQLATARASSPGTPPLPSTTIHSLPARPQKEGLQQQEGGKGGGASTGASSGGETDGQGAQAGGGKPLSGAGLSGGGGGGGQAALPSKPIASSLPSNPSLPAKPLIGMPHQSNAPVASGSGSGGAGGSIMSALYLGDMYWWTSDEHISQICEQLGAPIELRDVFFSEHKVNGKSKGTAYIEFRSAERAALVKDWFEVNDFQNKRMTVQLAFGGSGRNPFQTLPKEPAARSDIRGHRHASGPAALGGGGGGGGLSASAHGSGSPAPYGNQKPFHHQQQQPPPQQTYTNFQPQHQNASRQSRHVPHPMPTPPPPPPPHMPMMPFSPTGMNPAMMQMMQMNGYGGGMFGAGPGAMGGYSGGMGGFGGGFGGGVGTFNPAFFGGGAMGVEGAMGFGEGSDDGSRKRSRMEG